jgi:transposase InsO family protein
VVPALLKDVFPRYGIPIFIGSDNGPAFVAEVLKQLAKGLKITWNLYTGYRSQSSGKVERINWTLKTQISKLCQETHLTREQVLPLVLLRVRYSPTKQTGFSPYDILYRRSPPLVKDIKGDLKRHRKSNLAPTDTVWEKCSMTYTAVFERDSLLA